MNLVTELSLPIREIQPISIASVTGETLTQIHLKTIDIHIIISGNYHEVNYFFCV